MVAYTEFPIRILSRSTFKIKFEFMHSAYYRVNTVASCKYYEKIMVTDFWRFCRFFEDSVGYEHYCFHYAFLLTLDFLKSFDVILTCFDFTFFELLLKY